MKELNIEEKAKAYDEALETARKINSGEGVAAPPGWTTCEVIFPELRESEDERISKEIIKYLEQTVPHHHRDEVLKSKEWTAWLEKQGEQKSIDDLTQQEAMDIAVAKCFDEQKPIAKYKVGDTIYYDSFGRLVSFVIANIVEDGTDNPMYEDKDGNSVFQNDIVEQKPANKVEPKFKIGDIIKPKCYNETHSIKAIGERYYILDVDIKIPFRNEDDWELVGQNTVWSEEDEEMLKMVIKSCEQCGNEYAYYWLKSLKDRVQLQSQWKPSDEQMKALEHAINCYSGISPTNTEEVYTLEIIKEQLKKLREE